MTVLDELAEEASRRVSEAEKEVPPDEMRRRSSAAAAGPKQFPFEEALRKEGMSFICEVKKASPSKGVISEAYPYLDIAKEYEAAGASCISVLTEPSRFLGDLGHLSEIASAVRIPVLRKDFVVDEYMVHEAKCAGASAVLLICSILSKEELRRLIEVCDSLSMSALVEAHDPSEVSMALECGARIIGVNNRDLKDFTVDHLNCLRLRPMVPENVLFVAESGIKSRRDVEDLERNGVDAVLIGETLMRSDDRAAKIRELRGLP
ncbi:MAG: indole-3-glycerol phosphate synthase TrpC [Candidatus Methanomethylophilaceae archaeon]|nr:indole-3-glycerol phosphate synthase TrpC [Candidatus Methanomethylophilaceae archaeon]